MATSLRQIVIADSIYLKIRQYCTNNQITLTTFYYEMLEWFVKNYSRSENLVYQASQNQGKKLSLWINNRQLSIIKKLSLEAKVSDARVIYTALMLYANHIFEKENDEILELK